MEKKTVLIIEDEEQMIAILKNGLQLEGHAVITAQDGKEGLEKIYEHKPDIIIMDVVLPVQDGYTTLKKLRHPVVSGHPNAEEVAQTPVIIMTGTGQGMEDLFELEGAQEYIVKPFRFEDLQNSIKRMLTLS